MNKKWLGFLPLLGLAVVPVVATSCSNQPGVVEIPQTEPMVPIQPSTPIPNVGDSVVIEYKWKYSSTGTVLVYGTIWKITDNYYFVKLSNNGIEPVKRNDVVKLEIII